MARGTHDDDQDPWVSYGVEKYLLQIGEDELGRRTATRSQCHLDSTIVLTGKLDKASDRVLTDMLADLRHEQHRRAGTLAELGGWTAPSSRVRNRDGDA